MSGTLVIAEVGVNHDGDVGRALELIDVAADAGADVVKFQSFDPTAIVTPGAQQAAYQCRRAAADSQLAMLHDLELDRAEHERLAAHCEQRAVEFLSTAFDERSLAWLVDLGIRRVKVPSGELTNGPLLLAYARTGLPLVISTGMATLGEVEQALAVIAHGRQHGDQWPTPDEVRAAGLAAAADRALLDGLTLLHCTSSYPAEPEQVNLAAMDTLRIAFDVPVGYSDHSLGTAVPLAAVARGAQVIEKHITLDVTAPGPDHAASLEPDGLRELVAGIRAVEAAIGSPVKHPTPDERETAEVARRSVVAARAIAAGALLRPEDLSTLRPGTGRTAMDAFALVGRRARRDYAAGELLADDE